MTNLFYKIKQKWTKNMETMKTITVYQEFCHISDLIFLGHFWL